MTAYFLGLGVVLFEPSVQQPQRYLVALLTGLPFILGVHLVCNLAIGAYRRDWGQSGLVGAKRVALATAIAFPIVIALAFAAREVDIVVPYSAVLLGAIGAVVAMGLVRVVSRSLSSTPSNQAGQ